MIFGSKSKLELKVVGMTCGHCEDKVEMALKQMTGVKKAIADCNRQTVIIEQDRAEELVLKKVKEAVRLLGYQVVE